MGDDPPELLDWLLVDQIILRALLREFLKRFAQQSADPEKAIREIGDSLQDFVNGYRVPDAENSALEEAKERARMNLDTLLSSFRRTD
jgi:hypothetical protein